LAQGAKLVEAVEVEWAHHKSNLLTSAAANTLTGEDLLRTLVRALVIEHLLVPTCFCACLFMFVCVYLYIYIYVYVYIYIYIYVYIYI
jgi:hypothetical protein